MAEVILGNHAAIVLALTERDRIREDESVALDASSFSKAIYLELKADDVEGMRRKIVAFGVTVLEMQDPHLYFQAPGGQVFRLVGTEEDLSGYEGTDHRELPRVFG